MNLTGSLTDANHTVSVGRIQRGMVARRGCLPKLPTILPELVIGSAVDHHVQTANHRQKPAKKSSAHKPTTLPSMSSPDPGINITGIPISSNVRLRYNVP